MLSKRAENFSIQTGNTQTLPGSFFRAATLLLFIAASVCAERLPVKIFTSADGLGSSFINSVARDSRGFLWFATRDGLSRFDGQQFVTYKIGGIDAPPGIEAIYEAADGVYWITTTNGTYRFDPNRKKDVGIIKDAEKNILDAELITPERGAIFEDSSGRLWFGGNSLYLIEEADEKFSLRETKIDFPDAVWRKYPIFDFYQTGDGSLWLTTKFGLIRRLPDERTVFYEFDESDRGKINDSIADAAGRIWLASDSFVYVFKPEPPSDFSAEERIVRRDFKSKLPKAIDANLVLPEDAGQFIKLARTETSGDAFRQIYESADKHIWITAGSFLLEYDGQNLRTYGAEQGLTAPLNAIAEDIGGNLWFGGRNGATRLKRFGMSAFG